MAVRKTKQLRALLASILCLGVVALAPLASGTDNDRALQEDGQPDQSLATDVLMSDAYKAARTSITNSESRRGRTCIEFDKAGERVFYTDLYSQELELMELELAKVVESYGGENAITGVSYCSRYDGLAIFLPEKAFDLRQALSSIATSYEPFDFVMFDAPRTAREMMDLVETNVDHWSEAGVVGITPDIYSGGFMIEVQPEDSLDRSSETVAAIVGSEVPISVTRGTAQDLSAGRFGDSPPPYTMSSAICLNVTSCRRVTTPGSPLPGEGNYCSMGVPVTVLGIKMLLTAGHCIASTYNHGGSVGSMHTTTFSSIPTGPHTTASLGDWRLLKGSSYSPKVYNGGPTGTTTLNITEANWNTRAEGAAVCTSGATTGQICRYFVLAVNTYYNWHHPNNSNVEVQVGRLTRMRHDNNQGPVGYDTNGWNGGDSGGPCYYTNGNGVTVMGIVTGRGIDVSNRQLYFCTQLSGLKAWAPGALLG